MLVSDNLNRNKMTLCQDIVLCQITFSGHTQPLTMGLFLLSLPDWKWTSLLKYFLFKKLSEDSESIGDCVIKKLKSQMVRCLNCVLKSKFGKICIFQDIYFKNLYIYFFSFSNIYPQHLFNFKALRWSTHRRPAPKSRW